MAAEEKKEDKSLKKPKEKEVKGPKLGAKEARLISEAREAEKAGLRGIVHLVGKDISGKLTLTNSLKQVKGVGIRLAPILSDVVAKELGLTPDTPIGKLNDEQLEKIEKVIQTPREHGVPGWLLNRQKDLETGKDKHLVGSDLTFAVKQDIEREKDLYTWKGFRHIYAKKVRGQSTRTSGRKGMTMGVAKKALQAARAAAAAPAKKEEKK
jgi:small subunit ribosomal protein S13